MGIGTFHAGSARTAGKGATMADVRELIKRIVRALVADPSQVQLTESRDDEKRGNASYHTCRFRSPDARDDCRAGAHSAQVR